MKRGIGWCVVVIGLGALGLWCFRGDQRDGQPVRMAAVEQAPATPAQPPVAPVAPAPPAEVEATPGAAPGVAAEAGRRADTPDTPWEVSARSGPVWVVHKPEDAQTVLATVDGTAITRADVKRRVELLAKIAVAEARARRQPVNRALRPADSRVLDQLIAEALLLKEEDRQGLGLAPEDAQAREDMLSLYNRLPAVYRMDPPSGDEFDKMARARRTLARATNWDQLQIGDQEVDRYYEDNHLSPAELGRDAVVQRLRDAKAAGAAKAHFDELRARATITMTPERPP